MARGISIQIGERAFENKTLAKSFYKSVLNRYKIGERVSDIDAKDLLALLERHEERDLKFGSGISYFEVRSGGFGTQCFWIIRTDGSEDDFSYQHCINRNLSLKS